jgi:superfamily I DNA and/or RNA helicase
MPSKALNKRFKMLDFQHRMEPGISAFPRDEFYKGEALLDANTIEDRNRSTPFNYRQNNPSSIWLNVPGNRDQRGGNKMEVEAVEREILKAIDWARENPPKHGTWEFAILTPYSAQYNQLVSAVKKLTGIGHRSFRFDLSEMKKPAPVTLFVSTTDKYQGQEADLVIISLVQTRGYGFLDSPNRMNVALTRARRKRIIIGKHDNFVGCRDEMLSNMAKVHTDVALVNN